MAEAEASASGVKTDEGSDPSSAVQPLGNKQLGLLLGAQVCGVLGGEYSRVAVALVAVTALNATALQTGMLTGVEFATILLAPAVGSVVDRVSKRRLAMSAEIMRALVVGLAFVLAWHESLGLRSLYYVVGMLGTLYLVHEVAFHSYVPSLASRGQLVDTNSKLVMGEYGAFTAGGGLAGAAIQVLGVVSGVAAGAVPFLASLLCLFRLPETKPPRSSLGGGSRAAFGAIRSSYALRTLAWVTAAATLGIYANLGVVVFYLSRVLELTPVLTGVALAAGGIGAALNALFSNRIRRRLGAGRALQACLLLAAAGYVVVACCGGLIPVWLPVLLGGSGLATFGVSSFYAIETGVREENTPASQMGSVTAMMYLLGYSTMGVGPVLGGLVAEFYGARAALLLFSAWMACVVVVMRLANVARLS